jgi:sorting nexin-8
MSLFGTSPTDDEPAVASPSRNSGGRSGGLFDDDGPQQKASGGLFDNGDDGDDSPWSMPTPRKQQSRAQIVRNLLPSSDVPDSYIETFDTVAERGSVSPDGVAKVFAAARLREQATQSRIVSLVAPESSGGDLHLGRGEFNVLMALVGLAQEGEVMSLDSVDERRRSECLLISSELLTTPFYMFASLPLLWMPQHR